MTVCSGSVDVLLTFSTVTHALVCKAFHKFIHSWKEFTRRMHGLCINRYQLACSWVLWLLSVWLYRELWVDSLLFFYVEVGWVNTWRTEETGHGPFQCRLFAGSWWIRPLTHFILFIGYLSLKGYHTRLLQSHIELSIHSNLLILLNSYRTLLQYDHSALLPDIYCNNLELIL